MLSIRYATCGPQSISPDKTTRTHRHIFCVTYIQYKIIHHIKTTGNRDSGTNDPSRIRDEGPCSDIPSFFFQECPARQLLLLLLLLLVLSSLWLLRVHYPERFCQRCVVRRLTRFVGIYIYMGVERPPFCLKLFPRPHTPPPSPSKKQTL